MEIEIKNGNIVYNNKIIEKVPYGELTSNEMFRPSEKKIWLEKINRWVIIWYFHDGSPIEIMFAEDWEEFIGIL